MDWKNLEEEQPQDQQWCWISNGNIVLFAIYNAQTQTRYARWSNGDTWEDYDCEFALWQPANPPTPPS